MRFYWLRFDYLWWTSVPSCAATSNRINVPANRCETDDATDYSNSEA